MSNGGEAAASEELELDEGEEEDELGADEAIGLEEDEDEQKDLVDRAQCRTLQVSYRPPGPTKAGVRTEDVLLDPRDAWRATAYGAERAVGAGDNLLLTSSCSVLALQQQADKENAYMASAKEVTDACRRDFLREERRLIEGIDRIARRRAQRATAAAARQAAAVAAAAASTPKHVEADMRALRAAAAAAAAAPSPTSAARPSTLGDMSPQPPMSPLSPMSPLKHASSSKAAQVAKQMEEDIRALRASASDIYAKAQRGGAAVVGIEEAQAIAETVGPEGEPNPEAIGILKAAGFDQDDTFTIRILLKRMMREAGSLMGERDRLKKLLAAVEAEAHGGGLFDALLAAIGDNTEIVEVIQALIEVTPEEGQRRKIEEHATNCIKAVYEQLLGRRAEIEPQLGEWRELLQEQTEKKRRAAVVENEVQAAEKELEVKLQKENALTEEWERRRQERHDRRRVKKEERHAERDKKRRLMEEAMEGPIDVSDYLTKEEKARLQKDQSAYNVQLRKASASEQRAAELQAELQAMEDAKEAALERVRQAKEQKDDLESEVTRIQERFPGVEASMEDAAEKLKAMVKVREELEDEYTAATMPPPNEDHLIGLEQEVAAAAHKNQELLDEENRLWARVELYEQRWDRTENAWKAKKEEELAAEFYAKLAAEEAAAAAGRSKKPKERPSDPMLWAYYERVGHPEYAEQRRHQVLHTDERARLRQKRERQKAAFDFEEQRLMTAMESSTGFEASSSASAPRGAVPLSFYRTEDLRVRLRGSEKTAADLADAATGHASRVLEMQEALRLLGFRAICGGAAADVGLLHQEVAGRLSAALEAASAGADPSDAVGCQLSAGDRAARQALEEAVRVHAAALSRTEEAWQLAEVGCQQGSEEALLQRQSQACASCEDELVEATRRLADAATASSAAVADGDLAAAGRWASEECEGLASRHSRIREAHDAAWSDALTEAGHLSQAREAQEELRSMLLNEEKRKVLLEAEAAAPLEAKRAIHALRTGVDIAEGAGDRRRSASPAPAPSAAAPSSLQVTGRSKSPPRKPAPVE